MPSFVEKMASRMPEFVQMLIANRKVRCDFLDWENNSAFKDVRTLSEDQLKTYLESEWTRAKELDDKLYKLTAALSVAVTVGGVLAKTIFDGLAPTVGRAATMTLLFISMALFLIGAIIGFGGLRPKPRYGYGARFIKDVEEPGERAKREYERAVCGFQAMNLVRSNEATAAIGLIRNGVLLFALAIAFSFFTPRISSGKTFSDFSSVPAQTDQCSHTAPSGLALPTPKYAQPEKKVANDIVHPNLVLRPPLKDLKNLTEKIHPQRK